MIFMIMKQTYFDVWSFKVLLKEPYYQTIRLHTLIVWPDKITQQDTFVSVNPKDAYGDFLNFK